MRQGLRNSSFQFHKGTIKTDSGSTTPTTARRFQFHKGTIKTPEPTDPKPGKTHFNSIKVQLKRASRSRGIGCTLISIP